MRPQDLPGYSHVLSLFTCRIYRKRFRAVIGLCFVMQTHPRLRPYMRFLFVRPEVCPLGDLLTPKIRLSSDSASRRTPLPLANPSHCRADSGLSPYRTCAHRAHINHALCQKTEGAVKHGTTSVWRNLTISPLCRFESGARCIGRTRPSLLQFSGRPLREVTSAIAFAALHPPAAL